MFFTIKYFIINYIKYLKCGIFCDILLKVEMIGRLYKLDAFKIRDNINLYYINDNKYKTTSITAYVNRRLKRNEVTKNALLCKVLARGTSKYNTIETINSHLENLYGTLYSIDVLKKANIQCIQCSVSNISDKFTGENITDESAKLMLDFLFDPYVVGGVFDSDYVESEKQNLKDDIEAIVNDKRAYANMRVIEEMCKDEDNAIMDCGYVEDLPDINNESLYEHYKKIIFSSPIDIYVVGDTDIQEIKNVISEYLSQFKFDIADVTCDKPIKKAEQVKYVDENMAVNQGKLAIGCRTGINIDNPLYYALLVGNSIFGAGAHSKLFNNVREKMSLCYYASSRLDKFNALMIISSGIEFANYDKAKSEIFVQLDAVKKGDFTDDELNIAKSFIINSYNSFFDSPYMLRDYYFGQKFCINKDSLECAIKKVDAVTRQDITDAFLHITVDTVYFLQGKEE